MKNRTGELREQLEIILGNLVTRIATEHYDFYYAAKLEAVGYVIEACKEKGMAFVVDRELPLCPEKPECQLTDGDMDKRGVKPQYRNEFICYVGDFRHAYITAIQDMIIWHRDSLEEIDIEENTD